MKPYPSYRPSGVDWLGEVPEGWGVKRLGVIAEELQTGPFGSQIHTEDYISGGIPLINPSNIVDGKIVPDDEISVSEETALRLASHALLPGDIVLARRGELGRCAIVPDNSPVFLCGTGSLRLRLKKEAALPSFISECIRTPRVREWLSLQSVGSTMENLNATIASRIQIPLPPLAEQRGIAEFLDLEVGKIDALVAEQRQLIALLAEKRQATISTAVTRGLSPDTPLKPSGVDWLGDIPEGWEVVKLRRIIALNPSKGEAANRPREEEVTFLPMEAVGENGSLDRSRTRPIGEVETGYTYMREGDVAFAKITPCFENGKGAHMTELTGGIAFGTTELTVLRPKDDRLSSEFLYVVTASADFRRLGEGHMYGAGGQKRVPDDFVREYQLLLPPHDEQAAIVAYVSKMIDSFDALTTSATEAIALLLERRAALISAAVTGKIDVQHLSTQ